MAPSSKLRLVPLIAARAAHRMAGSMSSSRVSTDPARVLNSSAFHWFRSPFAGLGVEPNTNQQIALARPSTKWVSHPTSAPVRFDRLGSRLKVARIADHGAGLKDRQQHAVASSTARSRCSRGSHHRPYQTPMVRLGARWWSDRSCSACTVIETSTAKATHHGAATERAHLIGERPIPEASARAEKSRSPRRRLTKSEQCEPIRLSGLKVAGRLPRVRAGRAGLAQAEALKPPRRRAG